MPEAVQITDAALLSLLDMVSFFSMYFLVVVAYEEICFFSPCTFTLASWLCLFLLSNSAKLLVKCTVGICNVKQQNCSNLVRKQRVHAGPQLS